MNLMFNRPLLHMSSPDDVCSCQPLIPVTGKSVVRCLDTVEEYGIMGMQAQPLITRADLRCGGLWHVRPTGSDALDCEGCAPRANDRICSMWTCCLMWGWGKSRSEHSHLKPGHSSRKSLRWKHFWNIWLRTIVGYALLSVVKQVTKRSIFRRKISWKIQLLVWLFDPGRITYFLRDGCADLSFLGR